MTSRQISDRIQMLRKPGQTVYIVTETIVYKHQPDKPCFRVRLSILPWMDQPCEQWECASVEEALEKLYSLNEHDLVTAPEQREQEVPCVA
jgi:hypothetical protein